MGEAKARGQGQPAPAEGRQGKGNGGSVPPTGGSVALAAVGGIGVGLMLLAVVGAGFALSFEATREVAEASRIRHNVSWLMPVAIDGAMMIATIVAIVFRRLGLTSNYPMVVVISAALLSVSINGVHAVGPASASAGPLVLTAGVRFAISAIPGGMLALSVHLAATFLDSVSGVTKAAPDATHATHATHATPRRQPVKPAAHVVPSVAAPAPAPQPEAEATPALPSAPAPEPEAAKAARATEPASPSGTVDELRARRDEHAYEALRTWWLTPEAKAEISARRGNDGFPNRAEAKRVCKASSDVADRARARLREECQGNEEATVEASQ